MAESVSNSGYDNVALPKPEPRRKVRKNANKKLQRGRRQLHVYRYGFSRQSLLFLAVALLQAILITGLMIPVPIVGNFTGELIVDENGTTFDDLSCKEKSILQDDVEDGNIPVVKTTNSSGEPTGLGEDKEIYVILFLIIAWYNFGLLIYALKVKKVLEVGAFLLLNILMTIYGCVQVYQFRSVGNDEGPLTAVGYLALANTCVLLIMTLLILFLFRETYFEFGWKVYKKIRRNDWRFYYRWYESLMSCGKLNVLFTVIFELGQCTLFLDYCNYEFYLSIVIVIAAIAIIIASRYIVRNEWKYPTIFLVVILVLQAAYLLFKIVRFSTRSCPLCRLRVALPFADREQTFEHLIMLAAVNLVLCVCALLLLLLVWYHYGKGLRDHFRSNNTSNGPTTEMVLKDETDTLECPLSSQFMIQPDHRDVEAGVTSSLTRVYFDQASRKIQKMASVSEGDEEKQTLQLDQQNSTVETNESMIINKEDLEESITQTDNSSTPPLPRPKILKL